MLLFLELTNKGEAITISTSIKLPVGIENFEEIRTGGYYYVDKTKLIKQLFASGGKVNLFTRPRRFGKTLNMSMLKCFLEIGAKPSLRWEQRQIYLMDCIFLRISSCVVHLWVNIPLFSSL